MRFTLAQEHIDHFHKAGSIEFDSVFSQAECEHLLANAESALIQRLQIKGTNVLENASNEHLFLQGRNLWREGLDIKKLCTRKQIGEIAYHLLRRKPLKLAYDQYLRTGSLQDCPFPDSGSLQEISCIRPLLGALMILLSPSSLNTEDPFVPKKAGNALFISGTALLPLKTLFLEKNLSILVIAFTAGKAIYCLEAKDPHTHALKREGLVFGDAAGEDLCPTLYHG